MSPVEKTIRGGGFVTVQVVFVVVVFAALAMAHYWSSTASLHQSKNHADIQTASLEAESGLEFLKHVMGAQTIPGDVEGQDQLQAIADNLSAALDGTPTLNGGSVTCTWGEIAVPPVDCGVGDRHFSAVITPDGSERFTLTVTGCAGNVTRTVAMDFVAVRQSHPVFQYGIAAEGPISFQNTISVHGANAPWEADLFSAWDGTAFRLEDHLTLEGDVYAGAEGANVLVNGDGTIGGAAMDGPGVFNHVHIGVGEPEFPAIDISPFVPYVTSHVTSGTNTNGGTFENVRIKSGTDPSFTGGATLNGVILVEAGNQVTFGAGTTITGIVVTEDGTPATDMLRFEDETTFQGLDDLPETEQWSELRELAGAILLAPGFRVKFENRSGAFDGYMAAEHFKFENTFVGDIEGGIVSYGTLEISAEDGSSFTIDRAGWNTQAPIGFVVPKLLCAVPSSYSEG